MTTQHTFDQPMNQALTYRERIELEYASHFIPFLKHLENELGHDQVIESLQELACQGVKEYAENVVKAAGKNDLSIFKEIFSLANPGLSEVMTMQVLESTEEIYTVNVTECLLVKSFGKPGLLTMATPICVVTCSSRVWLIPGSTSI